MFRYGAPQTRESKSKTKKKHSDPFQRISRERTPWVSMCVCVRILILVLWNVAFPIQHPFTVGVCVCACACGGQQETPRWPAKRAPANGTAVPESSECRVSVVELQVGLREDFFCSVESVSGRGGGFLWYIAVE